MHCLSSFIMSNKHNKWTLSDVQRRSATFWAPLSQRRQRHSSDVLATLQRRQRRSATLTVTGSLHGLQFAVFQCQSDQSKKSQRTQGSWKVFLVLSCAGISWGQHVDVMC